MHNLFILLGVCVDFCVCYFAIAHSYILHRDEVLHVSVGGKCALESCECFFTLFVSTIVQLEVARAM